MELKDKIVGYTDQQGVQLPPLHPRCAISYVEDENNMIKQGDCLELMKEIPSGSVDLILTDPPYCVGASSNGIKSSFSEFNLMREQSLF